MAETSGRQARGLVEDKSGQESPSTKTSGRQTRVKSSVKEGPIKETSRETSGFFWVVCCHLVKV